MASGQITSLNSRIQSGKYIIQENQTVGVHNVSINFNTTMAKAPSVTLTWNESAESGVDTVFSLITVASTSTTGFTLSFKSIKSSSYSWKIYWIAVA